MSAFGNYIPSFEVRLATYCLKAYEAGKMNFSETQQFRKTATEELLNQKERELAKEQRR